MSESVLGMVNAGGFRGYLDSFDRRDLLPYKFDRAFAGVSEPSGKPVYNVDAVLAILGGIPIGNLRFVKAEERARLLTLLDDLNNEHLYKQKGRGVIFVSFGIAVASNPASAAIPADPIIPGPSSEPQATSPAPKPKPKRKK